MISTSAIDAYYTEKSWTRYPHVALRTASAGDLPQTEASHVISMDSSSGAFAALNKRLARAGADEQRRSANSILVWDYELLAADSLDIAGNGGKLARLSQDWNGHPAGSLVMEIYYVPEGGDRLMDIAMIVLVQNAA